MVHSLLWLMPALPETYEQLHFNFYGKILAGSEKQEVRYRRIINTCIGMLPESTGEIFVRSCFDEKSKASIYELVDHIMEAFRVRIINLSWMTDQTKECAFKKLDTFLPLLGYPDQWRSFDGLNITDSYVKNLLAVPENDWQYDVGRLSKPVNRHEWLMSSALVNAYYSPNTNGITFPAGILQRPLFDAEGDFATNYGGIGAVIGHEITHGFDDKGALFDEKGRLESWWTDSDWEAFNQKTKALAHQYNQYMLEDQHLNGELTLGENIADLAGILIAYDALQKTLDRTGDRMLIDGFTPEQRFFIAYARIWRENMRPELALHLMVSNPHSPHNYRVNGVLPNVDAFYDAFSVKPGDGLYLSPEKRVRIW
jgi:putative endopeptidase